MELFKLLRRQSANIYLLIVLLGLVNSIWTTSLLLLINNKINGVALPFLNNFDWLIYSGMIITSFLVTRYFQGYLINISHEFGTKLSVEIFDRLRSTDYQEYLGIGENKIRTAMDDVNRIQRFPIMFIEAFNSVIIIFISVLYLFWINYVIAMIVIILLATLATYYYHQNKKIIGDLNKARDLENVFHGNVNDFLNGFKEIKMSSLRSDTIFNQHIVSNRYNAKELIVNSLNRYLNNELFGTYAFYFLIGTVVFLIPAISQVNLKTISSFVITILYLIGPIGMVIGKLREFTLLNISAERLDSFSQKLKTEISKTGLMDIPMIKAKPFQKIRFENVTFDYKHDSKSTFELLPISLEVSKGECIFITGGNGSGKSTFINLFTGLYKPASGTISYNDCEIQDSGYSTYMDSISAVFTDCYLFEENYNEFDLSKANKTLIKLLEFMKLDHVIKPELNQDGFISKSLSKGQQKRLALVYAIMEEKEIIVLDEWAAEQDPGFRRFFYTEIIPYLLELGKTVIAVTHDDHYFDCASRVIEFRGGAILQDKKPFLHQIT
ncbi:putative ATP-binding cassette transporter/putative ATP-binding cassette transporter [Pedobacter terrae]|uniref:Putative ATP-binding cassette transporter/putative ATP-binding cassette transporter n=1 Tax=Pedobacter terrae TaxID=405671 RepID=A0A1G8EEF1_9SPHI|nr:cyclic peptide export ABC transporter [Pedobacter terrae]SDH68266.1 putative ATP-binding cassette transporter/putative ATP-binding cassette transporter [Pedobacter terrae]